MAIYLAQFAPILLSCRYIGGGRHKQLAIEIFAHVNPLLAIASAKSANEIEVSAVGNRRKEIGALWYGDIEVAAQRLGWAFALLATILLGIYAAFLRALRT